MSTACCIRCLAVLTQVADCGNFFFSQTRKRLARLCIKEEVVCSTNALTALKGWAITDLKEAQALPSDQGVSVYDTQETNVCGVGLHCHEAHKASEDIQVWLGVRKIFKLMGSKE
jgi:7-cyano-7-deazaguanine synthase in queuosine biosynthesis